MSSYQKRRKTNYYNPQKSRKRREFVLKPGLKGFLSTCNNREKDCIRESYNILNEYADILYGDEKTATEEAAVTDGAPPAGDAEAHSGSEEEDIENALNKELESLKAERTKHPNMRRFQVVDSGANNCIFIQTTVPDPVGLAYHIMKDMETTRKQKTRFLLRLLPIEITCKAYLEDIRKAADTLFDKYFTKEGKTFAVVFNKRNSSGVNREDLIRDLAEMVLRRHPDNRADLKHPELAVLVEVIRNICCLSVIPEYFTLRKYNLLELSTPEGGIKISDKKGDGDQARKGEGDKKEKVDIEGEASAEQHGNDGKGDCKKVSNPEVDDCNKVSKPEVDKDCSKVKNPEIDDCKKVSNPEVDEEKNKSL